MHRRIILLAGAVLFLFANAYALPKFASRLGVKCQSCHVNPTGKGMRTAFGQNYGAFDLTIPTWKDASQLQELTGKLSPNLSIGLDMRTLIFGSAASGTSSAFQMQGDIYLAYLLNKQVKVFVDKGLYSGFEIFALAKVLPLDGYIKVGKFMPAYGTRTDDHNAFIRGGPYGGAPFEQQFATLASRGYLTGLRFGERSEDTGLEVGFTPSVLTITAGVFNGTPGGGLNGVVATPWKTVALRADATFKTGLGNFMVGGSFYNRPTAGTRETFTGVFGAVTIAERYTLNNEVDLVTVRIGGQERSGRMFWNELNVMLVDGVDLKLGYEFYDPDVDLKNGSFSRITLGAELFLLPGVEVRPLYLMHKADPASANEPGMSKDEYRLLLHFFF